jgi:hypothetical protein
MAISNVDLRSDGLNTGDMQLKSVVWPARFGVIFIWAAPSWSIELIDDKSEWTGNLSQRDRRRSLHHDRYSPLNSRSDRRSISSRGTPVPRLPIRTPVFFDAHRLRCSVIVEGRSRRGECRRRNRGAIDVNITPDRPAATMRPSSGPRRDSSLIASWRSFVPLSCIVACAHRARSRRSPSRPHRPGRCRGIVDTASRASRAPGESSSIITAGAKAIADEPLPSCLADGMALKVSRADYAAR